MERVLMMMKKSERRRQMWTRKGSRGRRDGRWASAPERLRCWSEKTLLLQLDRLHCL